MRPDQLWPVRPHPMPGEALSGYAARLANANGIHPRHLLTPGYADATAPPNLIDRVAAAAGLHPDRVRKMTLAPLLPSIRGRGKLLRHGWRLHDSINWVCPSCTDQTGYRALAWRLALAPVCTQCQLLLTHPHADPVLRPAPPQLAAITTRLQGLVELACGGATAARDKLSGYRIACAALAQVITDDWPPRPRQDVHLMVPLARQWGPHPSPDPGTVATILLTAAPALTSHRARLKLLELLERGPGAARPSRPAPARPPRTGRRRPPGAAKGDRDRLARLVEDLAALSTRTGLHTRHVPGFLLLPDEHPVPHPNHWRRRYLAAIGLLMLLDRATGGPGVATTACQQLGTNDTKTDAHLDGLRLDSGITHTHATLIRAGAATLIHEGLTDYHARRAALATVRTLPRLPLPEDRLPTIKGIPGPLLAWGWVWVHTTRGPLWTSPRPLLRTGIVRLFDTVIDPETRLVLHETAHHLLAGPELDTSPAVPATGVIERRTS